MKEAKTTDILLLLLLGAIWGSSFFNIKIATYSFEPYTLALIRVVFATIFLVVFSFFYKIKIKAFSSQWKIYALVGLCNIAIPFSLIAVGTNKVDSYLAAILATIGVVLGAAYMLWLTKRVIFGNTNNPEVKNLNDINKSEVVMLASLAFFVIFFGFYPMPIMETFNASVDSLIENYQLDLSQK